ncbi:hypothetical protein FISHEDRAFT_69877 [Fistulina hepatica ATCC 64428]|uniref:Uncharacterized protein n=1 Tax=Fistulina hepatica ATCC 64428 TaxID=1128425 RepID=A0A0D7ANV7_9AGAR|nr:hypothetical protein FISHEDRAFT_69877 [Fistulina hepatica ATCC 64428]
MGTRGYRVYRWKRWYFVQYNHWDSYPSGVCVLPMGGLGVDVQAEIPRDRDDYIKWLERMKVRLETEFKAEFGGNADMDDTEFMPTSSHANKGITREQPRNDLFIEWIYEIDLDNEVFHVDSKPVFSLRNMPPDGDSFCDWISSDQFGHRSFSSDTPVEYRYNWKSAAPAVGDAVIARYKQFIECGHLSLSDDSTSASDLQLAQVRCHFSSQIMGAVMYNDSIGLIFRSLEMVRDRTALPEQIIHLGLFLLRTVLDPFLLMSRALFRAVKVTDLPQFGPSERARLWFPPDLRVLFATHLDDERNLQAAVVELIDECIAAGRQGKIHGIIFSILHCVVVEINMAGTTPSITHSSCLQFIPSFHCESVDTPGQRAISRLGLELTRSLFEHALPTIYAGKPMSTTIISSQTRLPVLPRDVFIHIALQLFTYKDLFGLATVSTEAYEAVLDVVRYPLVTVGLRDDLLWESMRLHSLATVQPKPDEYPFVTRFVYSSEKDHGLVDVGFQGSPTCKEEEYDIFAPYHCLGLGSLAELVWDPRGHPMPNNVKVSYRFVDL